MAEKQNIPEIRFEGFTDPWEQRKLGEIFEEYSEKNRADLPPLTIIQGGGTVYRDESNRNLQFDKNSLSNYKAVNPDDFIVHLRSFEGGLEKATYCGLISPAYHTFHGDGIDSDFYYLYFRSKRFIDTDLKPHVYGIRDGRSIDIDGMKTIPIPWTTVNEQRAIGGFYNSLDSFITLHQRKYDKLCTVKKSMLDKMFPKPGETEPEIRFEGFTDPWEQRKLGELLLFQNGFNGSSESFGSGIPLISVMDVLDDKFITHETVRGKARLNCEEASRYCVEYGDVLFQRSSENQEDAGTSNVYLDQHVSSAFGGFVIRGKKVGEYNPIFIKYLLSSPFIREQITHRAQGAQHINVSQDTLADVALLMPSMREQEAVGLVFLYLDNLITLHQRKLELLRNIKKSLLDRMFV